MKLNVHAQHSARRHRWRKAPLSSSGLKPWQQCKRHSRQVHSHKRTLTAFVVNSASSAETWTALKSIATKSTLLVSHQKWQQPFRHSSTPLLAVHSLLADKVVNNNPRKELRHEPRKQPCCCRNSGHNSPR